MDTRDYTAWTSGLIVLNDADLSTIIRQIERWYDVEFEMPKITSPVKVYGTLQRNLELPEILDALTAYYGLKFHLSGRRIIVRE